MELEADEVKVIDRYRRVKDHGFGFITVKVQDHKFQGMDYQEHIR